MRNRTSENYFLFLKPGNLAVRQEHKLLLLKGQNPAVKLSTLCLAALVLFALTGCEDKSQPVPVTPPQEPVAAVKPVEDEKPVDVAKKDDEADNNPEKPAERTITFSCNLEPGYKYTDIEDAVVEHFETGLQRWTEKENFSHKYELLRVKDNQFTWKELTNTESLKVEPVEATPSGELPHNQLQQETRDKFGAIAYITGAAAGAKDGGTGRGQVTSGSGLIPKMPVKIGDTWNSKATDSDGEYSSQFTLKDIQRTNGRDCAIIASTMTGDTVGTETAWIEYSTGIILKYEGQWQVVKTGQEVKASHSSYVVNDKGEPIIP